MHLNPEMHGLMLEELVRIPVSSKSDCHRRSEFHAGTDQCSKAI